MSIVLVHPWAVISIMLVHARAVMAAVLSSQAMLIDHVQGLFSLVTTAATVWILSLVLVIACHLHSFFPAFAAAAAVLEWPIVRLGAVQ